jgi:hypothetical protein
MDNPVESFGERLEPQEWTRRISANCTAVGRSARTDGQLPTAGPRTADTRQIAEQRTGTSPGRGDAGEESGIDILGAKPNVWIRDSLIRGHTGTEEIGIGTHKRVIIDFVKFSDQLKSKFG